MKRLVTLGAAILLSSLALSAETYGALAAPGTYFGDGNANAGWTISTNTNGNLELGLGGLLRFLGPLNQVGHLYTAPFGDTTVPGKTGSAWGFDYSVNTGADGSTTKTLADYEFRFQIQDTVKLTQTDSGFLAATAFGGFHPAGQLAPYQGFQDATSLHFSYLSVPLNYDSNALDLYHITLSARDAVGHADAATVSIDVQVVTPEPGTWLMLGTGLTTLGLMRRRSLLRNK